MMGTAALARHSTDACRVLATAQGSRPTLIPLPHYPGTGAVREGSALLQGLAVCGKCWRRLRTHCVGRTASPGYHCLGKEEWLVSDRANLTELRKRHC